MRVLFATPRFPGAGPRGDQLRAYQQLRHLAPRHAITLLTAEAPDPALPISAELAQTCERIVVVPRAQIVALARAGAALFTRRPLQVALYEHWPPESTLATLLDTGRFDLAHVQLVRLGGLFERLQALPRVLDLVDALSLNMQRRAMLDRGLTRWFARHETPRLRAWERRLCDRANAIAISAPADRDALETTREVRLVPNGVDPEQFPFVAARPPSARIVFGGNLGYFPNVEATLWFAREVLPLIRRQRPDAVLQLVGARPAAALRCLAAQDAAVQLIGPVARMHPYLAAAAVAIAPLRAGSGQQIKLLEAMASGAPLVATSTSAAGLDASADTHLLVADDAPAMAAAVLRLLDEPAFGARLASAAHALVLARYTWAQAAATLETVWEDAVRR